MSRSELDSIPSIDYSLIQYPSAPGPSEEERPEIIPPPLEHEIIEDTTPGHPSFHVETSKADGIPTISRTDVTQVQQPDILQTLADAAAERQQAETSGSTRKRRVGERGKDKKKRECVKVSVMPDVPIKYCMLCWMHCYCLMHTPSALHTRHIPKDLFENGGSYLGSLKKEMLIESTIVDNNKGWYQLTLNGKLKATEILTVRGNPFEF